MGVADNAKGAHPISPRAVPVYVPVAASQTLAVGDFIINDGDQAAIALANSARLAGVCGRVCSSLTENTLIPVFGWDDPDMVFVVRQDDTSTVVPGGEYDITGATGAMELDGNASTTDVLTTLYEVDTDESDAAGKRWAVRINKHHHATID